MGPLAIGIQSRDELAVKSVRHKIFDFAVLLEKLIEQQRVHRFIANGINLAVVVAHHKIGFTLATSSAINPNCGVFCVSGSTQGAKGDHRHAFIVTADPMAKDRVFRYPLFCVGGLVLSSG